MRFRTMGLVRSWLEGNADPYIDAVIGAGFRLDQGETLGVVGESGSGKTTLARAVLGLVPVHSGSIRLRGRELVGLREAEYRRVRRHLGLMFQDPVASLSPRKTVRSLLLEPFRIHRIPLPEPEAAVRRLLAMVGLHDGLLGAYPHQLSGGQARRVGVARTLALNPDLIIADEPTAGLDVSVQGEVLNLMNDLQHRLGLTYVIVTHNLPVIRHVSDRLVIMYLGRIVEEGATPDVFAGPAAPLHPRAADRRAAAGPRQAPGPGGARGRDPEPAPAALGLRVSHALSLRAAALPLRGAGLASPRRRAPGQLPLPAGVGVGPDRRVTRDPSGSRRSSSGRTPACRSRRRRSSPRDGTPPGWT